MNSFKVKFISENHKSGNGKAAAPPLPERVVAEKESTPEHLRKETALGLRYCHKRINANTSKSLENAAFLYAAIEILIEKGLLTTEELDERKRKIAERLVDQFKQSGLGLMYQDPEIDKYAFEKEAEVDCENRAPLCKAICCKMPFALSKQDVEEGLINWDFGQPYMIAHDPEDGYCAHLDRETFACAVREYRPVPCRGFDCRDSRRWQVWLDFEKKVINSELQESLAKKKNNP
jgi:Fe-S-cluster containining protein